MLIFIIQFFIIMLIFNTVKYCCTFLISIDQTGIVICMYIITSQPSSLLLIAKYLKDWRGGIVSNVVGTKIEYSNESVNLITLPLQQSV